MLAALASRFGRARDVLSLADHAPRPTLATRTTPTPDGNPPAPHRALVRVVACALTPCDWRTLSGSASLFRSPPFPYVPGGDVCGVVEAIDDDCPESAVVSSSSPSCSPAAASLPSPPLLRVGDRVVATWDATAYGGLAQYAIVDTRRAVRVSPRLSSVDAASLVNSALHAWLAVERVARVRPGERALVLGGSGGVGVHLVQLLKSVGGASFVAATSTTATSAPSMLCELGADVVLDHTRTDWSTHDAFTRAPFDVVFDCAVGVDAWRRCGAVLKSGARGGRFVAVTMDDPLLEIRTVRAMITGFVVPTLGRMAITHGVNDALLVRPTVYALGAGVVAAMLGAALSTTTMASASLLAIAAVAVVVAALARVLLAGVAALLRSSPAIERAVPPRYTKLLHSFERAEIAHVLALVDAGKLTPVLARAQGAPFPFTSAGVRDAFELLQSGRAKGKVVVRVADDDEEHHKRTM